MQEELLRSSPLEKGSSSGSCTIFIPHIHEELLRSSSLEKKVALVVAVQFAGRTTKKLMRSFPPEKGSSSTSCTIITLISNESY